MARPVDGSIDNAEARSLFSQLPDDLSLATAYEESVASADGTADILRIEADQVAKLEQMRVAIEGARKDAAARQTELEEEQGKRAQLEAAWQELWTPFELAAQAPRQMADWLQRRGKIIDRLRAVVQSETEAERLLGEAEAARREVRNCVAEITDAGSPASDTLSAWRSVAEQIVQAQERLATQREELRKAIETGERTLGTAEGRVNAVRISLEDWGQKWTGLMSNLGLAAATEPAAAQEIIQVRDDLQSSWTEAEGYGRGNRRTLVSIKLALRVRTKKYWLPKNCGVQLPLRS